MGNSEKASGQHLGREEQAMITALRDSGAIDFEQVGKVVSAVAPTVFDPGAVADDYVLKVVTSVFHVAKLGTEKKKLDEIEAVRKMAAEVRTEESE